MTKFQITELTYEINGAAIEVHKSLGPGLLESVYHKCMEFELLARRIGFKTEMVVPVFYKGFQMDTNLRCDLAIEECIVAELKSLEIISSCA